MNVEDLEKITAQMDDLEGWERILWSQAPWWRKILSKIAPWILPHDWTANIDGKSMDMRDGRLFNYLVCRRCGTMTESFVMGNTQEFVKRYRRCGCLGRKKHDADRSGTG